MEIVSYLVKSIRIEEVIRELQDYFCSLDIFIKDEGHDFYLIQFFTFNKKKAKVTENDVLIFDLFFKDMTDAIMSYEKINKVEH